MAVFLVIGTVVLTTAVVYVAGVEQGVNSQHPEIAELYRKLNPDVLINWLPYMHPLKNSLLGSAVFTGICWIVFFIAISLQAKKRAEVTEAKLYDSLEIELVQAEDLLKNRRNSVLREREDES